MRGNRGGPGIFGYLMRLAIIAALLFGGYLVIERMGGASALPDKISAVTDKAFGKFEDTAVGFNSKMNPASEEEKERQKILDEIKIEPAKSMDGFSREKFLPEGYSIPEPDNKGCTIRGTFILESGTGGNCLSPKGPWTDAFDKKQIDSEESLMVASVVPWEKLWAGGASDKTPEERKEMAIDRANMVISSKKLDRAGKGLDEWTPEQGKCEYADAYARVILKNELSVTEEEYRAMGAIWGRC